MSNFLYDSYVVLNKIYSEGSFLKQAISSVNIEPKTKALTVKIVYGVIENDLLLSYYIKKLTDSSPKLAVKTILKQSMYLIKFSKKPVYAVTNEAVDLAKKLGKKGIAGFINAVLRNFVKQEILLPEKLEENLSLTYSYPIYAVTKLIKSYGLDSAKQVMNYKSNNVTLLFSNTDNDYFKNYNLEETPFKNVYFANNFVRDEGFDSGIYTYQSIGSVAICEIVEPCKNFLDACAAPGGKSINIAKKCENVTSFDIYPHRIELIESYKKRMDTKNVTAVLQDASVFNEEYKQKFDSVLADVPCSGFGVIHENPDIKINRKENDILEIIKIQKSIIKNIAEYVKLGGFLYYSTCSVFVEENEEIIKWFLKSDNRYIIEKIESPLKNIDTNFGLQFLPHISLGAGFFIAKMKRVK
jgi:16S rRNA (cytosine967-C5)-methyltransferase